MTMRYRVMDITGVSVPTGRNFDQPTVDKLKLSMTDVGLLNPISVQREGHQLLPFWLIAGRNRLEAARQLGWETIAAIEIPFGAPGNDAAALAEIAENLHRRELTKLERSELHTRWVEIVKVREVPAPFGGVQPNNKGIRAAARDLGEPEKNLRQSVAIAGLTPEAKDAARSAGLDDNQSALLEAAKAPPEKQVEAIQRRAAPPIDTTPLDLRRLRDAWSIASEESRATFLAEVTRTDGVDAASTFAACVQAASNLQFTPAEFWASERTSPVYRENAHNALDRIQRTVAALLVEYDQLNDRGAI